MEGRMLKTGYLFFILISGTLLILPQAYAERVVQYDAAGRPVLVTYNTVSSTPDRDLKVEHSKKSIYEGDTIVDTVIKYNSEVTFKNAKTGLPIRRERSLREKSNGQEMQERYTDLFDAKGKLVSSTLQPIGMQVSKREVLQKRAIEQKSEKRQQILPEGVIVIGSIAGEKLQETAASLKK
ncbi:MAG: hypothetical protein PHW46_00980 [Candidatus Omnitrophica bacterium]|nr:hypothetical protein [Candidatus Omnitrophota bacterium]